MPARQQLHSCISISAPCTTFQHAVYLLTQTRVCGVNIGKAQIYLADGTYPETVPFPATMGIPTVCATCSDYPISPIEIIGHDTNPGNVVVAVPNGGCAVAGTLNGDGC